MQYSTVYRAARRLAATALALVLLAVAMAPPALAATRGPLVLAAASLQESLSAAADAWAAKGHARPVLSFAASSVLARQAAAGAPADLFVSADGEWMDFLAQRRLIDPRSRATLVGNALVLVAPRASPVRLALRRGAPLAAALGPAGRLAMADPDSVPAGRYGRQALESLALWAAVAPRVARAENVRAALALVARGAAPLGVVYATDARAEPAVRIVAAFPAASHAPIVYPLARLTGSTDPEAEGFRRFLLSAEGQAVFRRFGFAAR